MTERLISFVSLKGGARKSSHLIALAAGLLDAGHTVRVLDADPQGTAEQWLRRASSDHPMLQGEYLDLENKTLDEAYEALSAAANGVDFTLLDTPGAATPAVSAALLASDLVLTPFRLTEPEVDGLATTRELFVSALRAYGDDPDEANNLVALFVRGQAFISNAERAWLEKLADDFYLRAGLPETPLVPRWVSTGRTPNQLIEQAQLDSSAVALTQGNLVKLKDHVATFATTIKELIDA